MKASGNDEIQKVYTKRAYGIWTFNGSGTIDAKFQWQQIAGQTGDTAVFNSWQLIEDGSMPGAISGQTFNGFLDTQKHYK